MLRDFVVVVVVVHTRPWAILLAIMTMRKAIHRFLRVLCSIWGNGPLLLFELIRVENLTLEVVFIRHDDKTGKRLADFSKLTS